MEKTIEKQCLSYFGITGQELITRKDRDCATARYAYVLLCDFEGVNRKNLALKFGKSEKYIAAMNVAAKKKLDDDPEFRRYVSEIVERY